MAGQMVTHRIEPSNYYTLSEEERSAKLRGFVGMISRMESRLDIVISGRRVEVGGVNYLEKSVHLSSVQDMGEAIAEGGFRSVRLDTPHRIQPERELADHMVVDGRLCRAHILYDMSRSITPAWVNHLYDICGAVLVRMWPLSPVRARRMLVSHANITGARPGRRHLEESGQAAYVRDLIEKGESSLVEVAVTLLVYGADRAALAANCRRFARDAAWRQVRCASIRGMQRGMLEGAGHRFLFELGSCAAFYPFESANMIETGGSGGVYLGTNTLNGTPVIYDYLRRVNSNVTFLGESGRGKSTTAKTYVANFLEMARSKYGEGHRVMLCIIDPHGEYAPLAAGFGATLMDVEGREQMGLDPFKLFENPSKAASLLADASGMPPNLRSVAVSAAAGCRSVPGLVRKLTGGSGPHHQEQVRAASYLLQFTEGDTARIFRGRPGVVDRAVYTMRKADKSSLNAMIISMVMARAWRAMRDAPRHVPKLFVIDEGWFVSSMESTGQILEDIARSGRKENVHLLFLSQEPSDILDNPHGQSVLNNSATIFLFGLKADLAAKLQQVLRLSDTEREEVEGLERGHAILRADDHRIRLQVKPTKSQLERFNTAPDGGRASGPGAGSTGDVRGDPK